MITIEIQCAPDLVPLVSSRFRSRFGARTGNDGERSGVVRRLPALTTWCDAIEAIGIPRCEIGRIHDPDTGRDLDAAESTRSGARVRVSGPAPRALRPELLLCDSHLGKLARLLRTLGLDTAWRHDWNEGAIVRRALQEERIVLSRSRALLKRREMDRAQLIRSNDPLRQVQEVLERWRPCRPLQPFGRCGRCNGLLQEVVKADVASRIPPRTARWLDEYYLCARCDRLYWRGTHVLDLERRLAHLISTASNPAPHPAPDPSEAP